jgi:hypothetical protein
MRLFVLVLLLANGLYFGWIHGSFRAFGYAPVQQSEPQRLTQQVRPEAMRVLSANEAKRMEEQAIADAAPKECLVAGFFDAAQTQVLRHALESGLPAGAWRLEDVRVSERWIVYMGKYADADALAKKRSELTAMNLRVEPLNNGTLEPGLSLGGYESHAAAQQELARLSLRGIRTARVVQERAAGSATQLRLPSVTDALKLRVAEVKTALAGKALRPCPDTH